MFKEGHIFAREIFHSHAIDLDAYIVSRPVQAQSKHHLSKTRARVSGRPCRGWCQGLKCEWVCKIDTLCDCCCQGFKCEWFSI